MDPASDPTGTGDVIADINYFPALGTPIPTSAWKKRYLGGRDEYTRSMIIRDVRRCHQAFDLGTNGFAFVKLPSEQRVNKYSTEDMIRQEYYPELETLAKSL